MKYDLQIFDDVQTIDDGVLVQRADRVAYMDVGTKEEPKYIRMQGFTSMSDSKSSKEYSRRYVDEKSDRVDVSGYAPQISFEFDRYSPFPVHASIAKVFDEELLGSDTHRSIVTVDFFDKKGENKYMARRRLYSIIPDSSGSSTDALTYSGNFKAVGDPVEGVATISEDGMVAEFTTDSDPAPAPPTPVPTSYTVVFDTDGGSTVAPQTVEEGGKVSRPEDPTRDTDTFEGWFKDDTLLEAWDFDADTVTGDITLYAKWTV